jgi:hypothetical protein
MSTRRDYSEFRRESKFALDTRENGRIVFVAMETETSNDR